MRNLIKASQGFWASWSWRFRLNYRF